MVQFWIIRTVALAAGLHSKEGCCLYMKEVDAGKTERCWEMRSRKLWSRH